MSRRAKPPLTQAEFEATKGHSLRGGAELVSVMRGAKLTTISAKERDFRTVSYRWLRFERLRFLCDETPPVTKPDLAPQAPEASEALQNAQARATQDPEPHHLRALDAQREAARAMVHRTFPPFTNREAVVNAPGDTVSIDRPDPTSKKTGVEA